MVELRSIIETVGVRDAAEHPDPAGLQEAEAAVARMKDIESDIDAFDDADVRFHLALSKASGNEALYPMMRAVSDTMAHYLMEALRGISDVSGTLERLTGEHEAILEAVKEGRAEEAATLMRKHITDFYET